MSHTAGPWTTRVPVVPIASDAGEDRMILARAFDGSEKAIVDRVRGGNPHEADANARLIAAAPELLAALKAVLSDIDSGVLVRDVTRDGQPGWAMTMIAFVQRLQAAQRAVLKADEGR